MNRSDFIKLAKMRLSESKILLSRKKYSGAYYLCGYAIEYALKAYFAKQIKKSEFPDKEAVFRIYQHSPTELMKASGLQTRFQKQLVTDKDFAIYWKTVADWSEEARYEIHSEKEAKDLYKAISDPNHGVLLWIEKYL